MRILMASFWVLGLGSSWQDWKHKRVSNAWIFFGFLAAAYGLICRETGVSLGNLALHTFLVAIAAVSFWLGGIWPAGDAKLYFIFALLTAFIRPASATSFPSILFLELLINIFVLAGVFLFLLSCWQTIRSMRFFSWDKLWAKLIEWRRQAAKFAENMKSHRNHYALAFLNAYAIFFIMSFFSLFAVSHSKGYDIFLAVEAALLVFWRKIKFLVSNQWAAGALWPVVITGAFRTAQQGSFPHLLVFSLKTYVCFWLLVVLFQKMVLSRFENEPFGFFRAEELSPGMVLASGSWKSLYQGLDPNDAPRVYPDGLSADDIHWIKERCAKINFHGKLTALKTRPFAFWIFVGCLWTLFESQNAAQWLIWHSRFLR